MGHIELKTSSAGQSYKNLMYALEAKFSVQYSRKLVTMFVLMISGISLDGSC